MGEDFSAPALPVAPDLLLLVLLLSFSPFPAMTKSAFFTSLCALRRMKNQNNPNAASNTTTTGTTIAGIKVLKFDEDFPATAEDVAAAESEDVREEDEDDWAPDAVREAKAAELVTVEGNMVVIVPPSGAMSSCVVVTTVSADAALALTMAVSAVPLVVKKICEVRSLRAGFPGPTCGARLCKPWRAMMADDRDQSP